MSEQTRTLVVAACIKRYDNHYLMGLRSPKAEFLPSHWVFVGGKVDYGELPTDALVREVKEEIGIVVNIGAEIVRQDLWLRSSSGHTKLFTLVHYYAFAPRDAQIVHSDEIVSSAWVEPQETVKRGTIQKYPISANGLIALKLADYHNGEQHMIRGFHE